MITANTDPGSTAIPVSPRKQLRRMQESVLSENSTTSLTTASDLFDPEEDSLFLTLRAAQRRPTDRKEVSVEVQEDKSTLRGGLRVHVASACMARKGEDRHSVVLDIGSITPRYQKNKEGPQLQAFAGVYDGHDGPEAAKYCASGLLPHVLLEMNKRETADAPEGARRNFLPNSKKKVIQSTSMNSRQIDNEVLSNGLSSLQPHFCRAFENAQDRFNETGLPPTLYEVQDNNQKASFELSPTSKARKLSKFVNRVLRKEEDGTKPIRKGGTTACTMSIVSWHSFDPSFSVYYLPSKKSLTHTIVLCNFPFAQFSDESSAPFAIVANCGDSRLLSDRGGSKFRAVTKDHRVNEDNYEEPEMVRLTSSSKAHIQNNRVYPGGLAVSRTIGDAAYSSACIPTPECFAVDLDGADHQRFILATDGLWDSLERIVKSHVYDGKARSVRALVAHLAGREQTADPKMAAINLMKRCLGEVGCIDDITIVVLDVRRN